MKMRYGTAFLIGRRLVQRPLSSYSLLRASFATDTPSFDTRLITYLTDVEGDAAYLDRYVHQSKVLQFCESTDTDFPYSECIDFSHDNAVLVYGGDVWDRGGSDLYVIRQLLDLQQRHEKRVFFILGNRDLNKMRILSELGLDGQEQLPPHNGVYWLRGTGRQGDPLLQDSKVSQTNAAERLKWILSQTMGSPDAFQLRKKELQRESGEDVTDEDVVASYRQSCHPTGEMGQYLQQGHLALRLGNILFIHGALPMTQLVLKQACERDISPAEFWDDCDFAMPWIQANESSGSKPHSVNEWLAALEKFARDNVTGWKDYIEQLESDFGQVQHDIWSTKGWYDYSASGKDYEALLQYGMGWTPDGNRNPTVVYSSWLNNGLPFRFMPDTSKPEDTMFARLTREFFNKANLELIVAGHQPHGDMPTRIRIGEAQNILCCDTSYSGDTMWWNDGDESRTNVGRGSGSSGRGDVAASEVLIEQNTRTGEVISVKCHGTLSDGSLYNICHFPSDSTAVGQLASNELVPVDAPRDKLWWVKALFDDGSFLVSSGEGFNVWNSIVRPRTRQ